MEVLELLSPNRCYIEFGAGKGKLSHWIHIALKAAENVHFLLVERSSTRFKVWCPLHETILSSNTEKFCSFCSKVRLHLNLMCF